MFDFLRQSKLKERNDRDDAIAAGEILPEDETDDVDHDIDVDQYTVVGTAFAVDAAIALLESGGVKVVRSTSNIVDVEFGQSARIGNHLLVYRHEDAEEVAAVLSDAGLL